ncbi:MAG TPA: 6-phosphogluconolactonase [Steroidobacteraceae bacterium]|nr:6-phosphogluconolactonase [Steroidobacteraceae bacterium]
MTALEILDPATLDEDVAAAVTRWLALHERASLVVSGGRTPAPFLRALAQRSLPWSRIDVLLADERCVPLDHPASNQRSTREAFAGTPAATSLHELDPTTPGALDRWRARVATLSRPFAAVVLGMGEDGHFASLFPGMPGLAAALDLDRSTTVVAAMAPVEPRARLSLALAALLDTELLALHVTGAAKLATLRRAAQPGDPLGLPVRALLHQQRVPLRIYHQA